ncbi:hypothetical protein GLAREA_07230 [Glarea lozoyensis ATCC 20868]|uniref:Uncharacterized protein n=2 Tax=Glarea lozoyensis TaxID=101852 RepID=S3D6V1_GLAL2|nr:uncharacterized protein GLAREA_07230 [Glarea lozoyensis ATCC 20868]EHK96135.1 hypothetical protein M7I_8170 [Glarea lozoyensis 74030]EPE34217.1 hypothetical protein GLAREA_07230 [Glarea lozoyensis ATCC 20868]
MPVKTSDVLTIPEEGKWKSTPITWKQSFKDYNKNYLRIEFTNTRDGEAEKTNYLFVSEELLDNFKSSKIQKTDSGFKLTVDDGYVYGQQKGGKNRFLVYHDKDRPIFQHRFVEGTMVAISKQATDISAKLGYGEVKMVSSILSGIVGNKLHPMSEG